MDKNSNAFKVYFGYLFIYKKYLFTNSVVNYIYTFSNLSKTVYFELFFINRRQGSGECKKTFETKYSILLAV